VLVAIR